MIWQSSLVGDGLARARRKEQSRALLGSTRTKRSQSMADSVFSLWERSSMNGSARQARSQQLLCALFRRGSERWMANYGRYLGRSNLSVQGLSAVRSTCALAAALVGFVLGYGFGLPPSGVVSLCAIGALFASRLPFRVAKEHIQRRREDLERELPQMLAMVSLGLRGGLTFERSFSLYAEGFSTDFARACLCAQRRWEIALAAREDALRDLACSYGSDLLEQAVESMIRSLRFGTALSENLEALAHEARNQYRTRCEETIARAPVKMLVPTGTLILPAMLILVMGPSYWK